VARQATQIQRETLQAVLDGHRTPYDLGVHLSIDPKNATARLRKLKAKGWAKSLSGKGWERVYGLTEPGLAAIDMVGRDL